MSDIRHFMNLLESQEIDEKYSQNNNWLLQYMKNDEFDPYSAWWEVCHWLERNGYLKKIAKKLGRPGMDVDDLQEEDAGEIWALLKPDTRAECGEEVIEYLMQHNPAEAPSTAHMSLNRQKLLPRTTWLVHFSDNAEAIAQDGFKYGIDQMDKLGLTTYMGDQAKKYGGYNFAFLAGGRYDRNAAYQGKYGRHAVMFQNSGVIVSHHGDEEDQVIFHGTDVDPRNIVLLEKGEDGWQVMSKYNPRVRNSGRPVFRGEYVACAAWVMKHFAQYRKALTGF